MYLRYKCVNSLMNLNVNRTYTEPKLRVYIINFKWLNVPIWFVEQYGGIHFYHTNDTIVWYFCVSKILC